VTQDLDRISADERSIDSGRIGGLPKNVFLFSLKVPVA
jgi:hypothetical protein